MNIEKIKYKEGQWFAVPLQTEGYALGIIVRGSYINGGGLGYFFGPKFTEVPDGLVTTRLLPGDAILVARFSGIGVLFKRWPLINSPRTFIRDEWPLPSFWQEDFLNPEKGFLRDYMVTNRGRWILIREIYTMKPEKKGLVKDSDLGGGVVELRLTELLSGYARNK